MTDEHKGATIEREKVVNRIRAIQARLKLSERNQRRAQYYRKEDFYRNISDTVKSLGYSLLGGDAVKPHATTEAKFEAFVEQAESALITIVNDCLVSINALEDTVRTVRAESANALATLVEELAKDEDDDEYFSSCSSVPPNARCQVSTRKISKMIHAKLSSCSKEKKPAKERKVAKSRSVSSLNSGKTYVISGSRPPQDVVQRRYYMKEREAMFEERKSRPVVNLPKGVAKGAWGQAWHLKMVERKRLSLVDVRSRNKYAENRMGDSFQVFKEVKAIWKSNIMGGNNDGVDGKPELVTQSWSKGKVRKESATKRMEKAATEEKLMTVTQYEDFEEFPRWVKREHKKAV